MPGVFNAVGNMISAILNGPPTPQQPQLQAPPAQPAQQAASTPQQSQGAVKGVAQAGGSPGLAQTLLTGMAGVDPNSLQLGKSTLLGS